MANATAVALDRHGKLGVYMTGIIAGQSTLLGRALHFLSPLGPVWRNRVLDIHHDSLRSLFPVEAGARLVALLAESIGLDSPSLYDAIFVAHDEAVARVSWSKDITAIYAYEDAALRTFQHASARAIGRVWDLPIPHYRVVEQMWKTEQRQWAGAATTGPVVTPEWKKHRKDSELALATVISVASNHTRRSLENADVRVPVIVNPYGFPVFDFAPKEKPNQGPFTVLSVGLQGLGKGTHYLLQAWKKAAIKDARLRLVGPMRLSQRFLQDYAGLFEHVAYVPKPKLGEEYRAADVLAFPTLGDGFGLVIQEAMCCGTPVITTPASGGPESITDGHDGWLVPSRDVDALVARLRACAADRDQLYTMGKLARARAERWTWREAGDALVAALTRELA
ncbi:MAG TPA: glycosyltransferase family 4 protein [Polyangia bacterium]|nr:glycosyltransferase family 4 protein [Polyangia bacterium]